MAGGGRTASGDDIFSVRERSSRDDATRPGWPVLFDGFRRLDHGRRGEARRRVTSFEFLDAAQCPTSCNNLLGSAADGRAAGQQQGFVHCRRDDTRSPSAQRDIRGGRRFPF
jgi:hypothetical protein